VALPIYTVALIMDFAGDALSRGQDRRRPNKPSPTPGMPLVRAGFGRCHVPADWRQRTRLVRDRLDGILDYRRNHFPGPTKPA
jgi:hypothetical protein